MGVTAAGHRAELTTTLGCALAGSCPSGDIAGVVAMRKPLIAQSS
jgi:hypothetical protein